MDEFGVLVESIGFKSQKSVPMAHLKPKPSGNFSFSNGYPQPSPTPSKSTVWNDSFVDDLDGIFQAKNNINNSQKPQQYFDDGFDIFGGPGGRSSSKSSQSGSQGNIDLDSVFDFNNNSRTNTSSKLYSETLPTKSVADDDLLGNFGFSSENSKKDAQSNVPKMDDLIPGFGESSPSTGKNGNLPGANSSHPAKGDPSNSTFFMEDDPFSLFGASRSPEADLSRSFSDHSQKISGSTPGDSSIDELETFAMGKVPGGGNEKPSVANLTEIRISLNKKDTKARDNSGVKKVQRPDEFLNENRREKDRQKAGKEKNEGFGNDRIPDNFFDMGTDPSYLNRPRTQTKDPILDALFNKNPGPSKQKADSQSSYNKKMSVAVMHDDFNSLFGDAPPSGAFQEVEGESDERRIARWNHHTRTQERMAKALAEKNQRDFQTQYEQEERRRIAESLDFNIKRWSAGKEGNLLALLSSLQDVLWPECGWQPVSLTDLIAPTSVKKVYHKATLCVHPDKVQQKGSTLHQKYIAEKVFDLLKEAWNKYNTQGPQSSFNTPF